MVCPGYAMEASTFMVPPSAQDENGDVEALLLQRSGDRIEELSMGGIHRSVEIGGGDPPWKTERARDLMPQKNPLKTIAENFLDCPFMVRISHRKLGDHGGMTYPLGLPQVGDLLDFVCIDRLYFTPPVVDGTRHRCIVLVGPVCQWIDARASGNHSPYRGGFILDNGIRCEGGAEYRSPDNLRIDAPGNGFKPCPYRLEQIVVVCGDLVVTHNALIAQKHRIGMGAAHIEPDDHRFISTDKVKAYARVDFDRIATLCTRKGLSGNGKQI